jgi:hypothetical protein
MLPKKGLSGLPVTRTLHHGGFDARCQACLRVRNYLCTIGLHLLLAGICHAHHNLTQRHDRRAELNGDESLLPIR